MRRLAWGAVALAALGLSGCAGMTDLIGVNEKATPAAQKIKAEADARFTDALIKRLDHCGINGMMNLKAQVAPDAGVEAGLGLACLPQPWEGAVPLSQAAKAIAP